VETDVEAAIEIGVAHLTELGHKRITLLVNEPAAIRSVRLKVEKFVDTMHNRKLDTFGRVVVCEPIVWSTSYEAAYDQMRDVWPDEAEGRPTAIMTVSDAGAWAANRWLVERGVNVPKDVSILGFEDEPPSRYMVPALSSIAHPWDELVSRAVEILLAPPAPARVGLTVRPRLVVRESTRRAGNSEI